MQFEIDRYRLGEIFRSGDGIDLIPYTAIDGEWTIEDAEVMQYWREAQLDGTAQQTFYSGEPPSEVGFVRLLKKKHNVPLWFSGDHGLLGVAWVNAFEKRGAFAHFNFVKAARGRLALEAGRKALQYWFAFNENDTPVLDVICGYTPTHNRFALRFIKRLGFSLLGSIPHLAGQKGLTVSYITREIHG